MADGLEFALAAPSKTENILQGSTERFADGPAVGVSRATRPASRQTLVVEDIGRFARGEWWAMVAIFVSQSTIAEPRDRGMTAEWPDWRATIRSGLVTVAEAVVPVRGWPFGAASAGRAASPSHSALGAHSSMNEP